MAALAVVAEVAAAVASKWDRKWPKYIVFLFSRNGTELFSRPLQTDGTPGAGSRDEDGTDPTSRVE